MRAVYQPQKMMVNDRTYYYFDLSAIPGISRLPFTLKILLENLIRHSRHSTEVDGESGERKDVAHFLEWIQNKRSEQEIAYRPARVLMQDFTGVPAVVDLAAMRDAMQRMGGDPQKINPLCPVDLVIDHSVQVDAFGTPNAFNENVAIEMERNQERYRLLKWGQTAFQHFRSVPPGTGICHQVNLEYLAQVVWSETASDGKNYIFPDTVVGTDSHTTMVNALGVLGWGVGGIEAEAAMLGQPISMCIPEVVGVRLEGKLNEGVTATDLVLAITQMLRRANVVDKFVEFYGPGLSELALADRATIANMAPEYGATCGFFPIDSETIRYLELTHRDPEIIARVEQYAKAQGLWHQAYTPNAPRTEPVFSETLCVDLCTIQPAVAGPKRPQDRVLLSDLKKVTLETIDQSKTASCSMHHGDVVIAAITSCTNTSNPHVMLAAGLVAKKAVERGLQSKPWVKTSLAPGSKVVTAYLQKTGLIDYLNQLGFYLVGYGCTTCIGNSGPLPEAISTMINENHLVVSSVLSGNRNFEGRIHPHVKANWLASPPLVVAFALAGTTNIDMTNEPLGYDPQGDPVYLKEIWPTNAEIASCMQHLTRDLFTREYASIFDGDAHWQSISTTQDHTYLWPESTYISHPPYFLDMHSSPPPLSNILGATILAILGDSVTTDHISPAGSITVNSPAGQYLLARGVKQADFNAYGSRRGHHEVMMRGTFANIRIRNEMLSNVEGGFTRYLPTGEIEPIYDAAMRYTKNNIPLVIIAGKEYGTGSSRDWAAKGPALLGIKAVIAESFERIHRSNLIGMGIIPLTFPRDTDRKSLVLDGNETIHLRGIDTLQPRAMVQMIIEYKNGDIVEVMLTCGINTETELEYYRHGGILHYVLRKMLAKTQS